MIEGSGLAAVDETPPFRGSTDEGLTGALIACIGHSSSDFLKAKSVPLFNGRLEQNRQTAGVRGGWLDRFVNAPV